MPHSGQQPDTDQLKMIQDRATYWRTVGNEAKFQSIGRLEDAAKQLVGLTTGLQGLYLALFALSDLRKQLATLVPSIGGDFLLLVFFLPILFWLVSLYCATRVFVPQPHPDVNFNDLDVDAWQDIQRLHEKAADDKLLWVRRSHLWLVVSFVVVLGLLVVVAFLPGAANPGPTQVILVTPTPLPKP